MLMRTKFFLLSALAALLFACNGNSEIEDPTTEEPAVENTGRVLGTYKCYALNYEYVKVGYFIELNYIDSIKLYHNTLLCFHLEMPDSIRPAGWGEYVISPPVVIPYDFTYKILEWGDDGYEYFEPLAEPAVKWTPCSIERQILIYPKK